MDTSKTKKKKIATQNVLENLRDIGNSTASSITKDVVNPKDIIDQIMGQQKTQKKVSGEINAGQSLEMKDIASGRAEEQRETKKQISYERHLRVEGEKKSMEKINSLRLQLKALTDEVAKLSQSSVVLDSELKVAKMQAPIEPGVYHIVFFEKLLEFIKSYRRKVDDANIWLHQTNSRAQKKNYWTSYKKHGSKFLLSGEHYLSRSAG